MALLVDFDDYSTELRPLLGGKNASLGEMTAAGLPVPPGFALTTEAFANLWDDADRDGELAQLVAELDRSDQVRAEAITRALRTRIEATPLAAEVVDAVVTAYRRLCERCDVEDLPVAVRSSAIGEDAPDASFAGAHDTFLAVRGGEAVVRHVARCWSSLWTSRAAAYRRASGDGAGVAMSVGVQRMVRARAAGVAMTLNPVDGDRSQIAIDASWGLGKPVVAGEVTPDSYLVDKVVMEITRRRVSNKSVEYQLVTDGVRRLELRGERARSPCLTDDEIRGVARLARLTERHYGTPQDVEWAIDGDAEAADRVVLLQSRPETAWSRRARARVASSGPVVESIAASLCAPLHARQNARRPTDFGHGR